MTHTEESLAAELKAYCTLNNLEHSSADELCHHLRVRIEEIQVHVEWLEDFEQRWDTVTQPPRVEVHLLARQFGRQLYAAIGHVGVAKVIDLNRKEADPSICHSHDFCDANMVMLDAWCDLLGIDQEMFEMSNMSQAQTDCWNAAWTLAKRQEFRVLP